MFAQELSHLSESDINYVSQLIKKLETEYKDNPLATQDTLYRIATNAELFSHQQLASEGALTSEKTRITWSFIQYFKSRNQKSLLGYMCRLIKNLLL